MESTKRLLCEGGTKTRTTLRQCYENYSSMGTSTEHDVSKRFCEAQKVIFITIITSVIILLQNEFQCFHFRTVSNVECSQTEAVVGALPFPLNFRGVAVLVCFQTVPVLSQGQPVRSSERL